MSGRSLERVVKSLPTTEDLRQRLSDLIRERRLLQRLLKVAEDRDRLRDDKASEGRADD